MGSSEIRVVFYCKRGFKGLRVDFRGLRVDFRGLRVERDLVRGYMVFSGF